MANILDMQKKEERQLVRRVLSGEELAWKQFLLRYKKSMYSAIRSHLKKFSNVYDEFREEDVYQEVLAKLHRTGLAKFLENEQAQTLLRNFLYTVALNYCKDFVGSKLGQANLQEVGVSGAGEEEDEGGTISEVVFSSSVTVEDEAIQSEMRALLLDEILKQDAKTQKILRLYLMGEKNKDISEALKMQENKVNKVVFNFKSYLTKKYQNQRAA